MPPAVWIGNEGKTFSARPWLTAKAWPLSLMRGRQAIPDDQLSKCAIDLSGLASQAQTGGNRPETP
jgi:hypothetical protein